MADKKSKIDKNIVDVTEWSINENIVLKTYTAKWCNPCKKVKPDVLKYMENYEIKLSKEIPKSEFKKDIGNFIPLFKIYKDDEMIKEIQTSEFNTLKNIFDEHFTKDKFEIDEDF